MKRPDRRIYRARRPLRAMLLVLAGLLVGAIILAVIIFFGFRSYIVHTPGGIQLQIPWMT